MTWSVRHRLQRLYRDRSLVLRRPARALVRALSIGLYRVRRLLGGRLPTRVVLALHPAPVEPLGHPAILVQGADPGALERFLAAQTETSVSRDPEARGPAFWLDASGDLAALPATHLEAMLLAAVAGELEWVRGGWAAPAADRYGPATELYRGLEVEESALDLLRLPRPGRRLGSPVLGQSLPHITDRQILAGLVPARCSAVAAAGPFHLHDARVPLARHRWRPVDIALAALPEVPGARSVLFLLPFLAVGGAERLLFDLLGSLGTRCRALVVTVEPHLARLGQTVDRARELTPHVYTLGDWLPREAHHSAVCHLIRRYAVESLVSWNGTTYFFDHLVDLRRRFAGLRIASQLFNHAGGWMEHLSSAALRDVDVHLAVNDRIAGALVERGVRKERVAVIHHGVRVPPEASRTERDARRRAVRARLGLPQDAVVVGTFVRLHPQKRPLDILAVAKRLEGRGVHFLLVGGGPLERAVDAELAARPLPNLTRLPMCSDATTLYDALDLCLLTSEYEGLPVFLLDGLARSLPCVATAVGEVPQLLAEGGGVLVDRCGDVDALAAGVEALLDPEARARDGARGRATVCARFGLERFTEAYAATLLP